MSMTGFGHGHAETKSVSIEVELKSVNSRFLDLVIKLPRAYSALESEVRDALSSSLDRGRVEVMGIRNVKTAAAAGVKFDREMFKAYRTLYRQILTGDSKPTAGEWCSIDREILSRREVLDVGEEQLELGREREALFEALQAATRQLLSMRAKEGLKLGADLSARLVQVEQLRRKLLEHSGQAARGAQEKLRARVDKLIGEENVDPARLATEIALLADRLDVSEELVRIEAHTEHFREALSKPPSGRKLDFLLQELGREFNTIGSKAQDSAVQRLVVEAKAELEKMREQAQNVE